MAEIDHYSFPLWGIYPIKIHLCFFPPFENIQERFQQHKKKKMNKYRAVLKEDKL